MTYKWHAEKRPHKNVILCEAEKHVRVTYIQVELALAGMGLCEWEVYMGELFTEAVSQAVSQNANTADITAMFSCDLIGVDDVIGEYQKNQNNVVKFLMEKLFDKVSENENELIVKVKEGLLC